ncbi:DUF1569 domain-containing protein [Chryseobacterium fistulae]|nr:DUF1569 domain-containing protein [Chryseobacterium fistulae]
MVKKDLHNRIYFEEILDRISRLSKNASSRWGKMSVSQMLRHCDYVLQVPLEKINLPSVNLLFETIGMITKIEMQIFNNGIPRNMPTFQKLIINFECDFDESKEKLFMTLDEYWTVFENGNLPEKHVLFGVMKEEDWGFLEYKHLNHHLKQFGI